MARNEKSEVRWKIDITGAQSLNSITKQLDEVLQKFRQIEKYQEQIKGGAGRGSGRGGGKKSGGFNPSSGYVSNRMAQMKLQYRKGEISSLKELQGHYGQVTAALNKMENKGKNVASQRLRLHKLNQKIANSLNERQRAMRRTNKAKLKSASSTDRMRSSMISNMGAMNFSQNKLKQVSDQVGSSATATKNASYTLLNMGYLIQDSPYGVRGMANNVSQLAQSWSMLNRRIQTVNATQGKNLTIWGQLGSMLKGPTGIMILIGSVLPAAMEYLNMYWDGFSKSVEKTTEELKASKEAFNSVIDASLTLREIERKDPIGVRKKQDRLQYYKERKQSAQELIDVRNTIRQQEAELFAESFDEDGQRVRNERTKQLRSNIKSLRGELSTLEEEFGVKLGQSTEGADKLKEKIDEITKSIETLQAELYSEQGEDAVNEMIASNTAAEISASLEMAKVSGENEWYYKRLAKNQIKEFRKRMKEAAENEDWATFNILKDAISTLEKNTEDDAEEAGKEIGDSIVEATANNLADRFNMAKWADQGIGKVKSNIRTTIDRLERERRMLAREGNTKAAKQANKAIQTLEDIGPDEDEGEGSQYQIRKKAQQDLLNLRIQRASQEVKAAQNASQEIMAIEERKNLKLEKLRHDYMESDEMSYRKMVQTRESIVFQSEQKIQSIREKSRKEDLRREKQKEKAKRNLVKQSSDAAITSIQAVAQFSEASARSQFQIQKVASASQAIINGYLAYTKTMAQGGFLAKPLAITAMLSSFAQAGKIMSQSFDSARATGAGGVGGASVGYRGLDFANSQSSVLSNRADNNPGYSGTNTGLNDNRSKSNKKGKKKIPMEISDGFGNIVAKGNVELDKDNKTDLGYWTNNRS